MGKFPNELLLKLTICEFDNFVNKSLEYTQNDIMYQCKISILN